MRAQRSRDAGFTLVEVMVSSVLMLAVVPIFGSVLISAMRTSAEFDTESRTIDDLRLSITAINRELRSATCIDEPHIVAPANSGTGDTLTFTTTSNGAPYDVRYTVAGGNLVREGLDSQGAVTETRIIAKSLLPGSVFVHASTPRESVAIDLRIKTGKQSTKQLRTSTAGRNAWQAC